MPSPLLASKVSISEAEPRIRTPQALRTAVAVFAGVAEKGPHTATLITSWEDYVRSYGGFTTNAKDLPAAVQGFYDNGGQFAYIIRVVHYSDITVKTSYSSVKATVTLVDRDDPALDTLKVDAISDGTWGNDLRIQITAATSGAADEFNLIVKSSAGVVYETWANLSMTDTATRYVETVLNSATSGSLYIRVTDLDSASTSPDDLPAIVSAAALTSGDNGLTGLVDADFLGSEAGGTGLWRLESVTDFTMLMIPGRTSSTVQNGMITYLTARSDDCFAIAILDPPANTTATSIVTHVKTTTSLYNATDLGALYWPRLKVANPSKASYGADDTITVPPCGHVAGVMARTDNLPGGIYRAAAGINYGIIRGALGLETDEAKQMKKRDIVYPANVNPITTIPGVPIHIDGNRTLKDNGPFPTVSERRGVKFIESTIWSLMQGVRHQNNTTDLRDEVTRTVLAFLLTQMVLGAFQTKDPETAFFVDFGDGLNPVSVQRQKKLRGRIGLATPSSIDYVELEFSQDQRALEAEIAAATF